MYGYKGNVCKERGIFVCQRCDQELRVEDRLDGEWVARFPSRLEKEGGVSGYWLHQLLRHNCSVAELIHEEEKDKGAFMNMYLGLPYNGSDQTVTKDIILRNTVEPIILDRNVTMGVDIGYATGHHYVIGSDETVFKIGTAKDFDEIERLMEQYNVQQVVSDNGPENESVNKLCEKYPTKVMKNYYNQHMDKEEVNYNEEKQMIYSARHRIFDRLVRDLNSDKYKFALDNRDPSLHKFAEHFSTLSCVVELDKAGNPQLRWKAPEHAADHYAHSFLYWRLAVERLKFLTPNYKSYNPDEIRGKVAAQNMEDFLKNFKDKEDYDWYNI